MAHSFTRRTLLHGMAGGVASLPFLPKMLSAAANASAPKRLVFFFTPNECIESKYWKPTGTGTQFALPTALPEIMKALEPHRQKLTVVGGMVMRTREKDDTAQGHIAMSHMLSGWARPKNASGGWSGNGGVTIDQFVAQRSKTEVLYQAASPGAKDGPGCISFRGKNQPTSAVLDPNLAIDRYFGPSVPADPSIAARLRDRKKSILDNVARELTSISPNLAIDDREKLDYHLTSIRDIEQRLRETDDAGVHLDCHGPDKYTYNPFSSGWLPETVRLQIDIAVQALACNLTNVATLQVGSSGGTDISPRWPQDKVVLTRNAHTIAHEMFGQPHYMQERISLEQWFFKQYAYLVAQMDKVKEGNGTLLDNSLVVFIKNLGMRHRGYPMVYVLAGGAGGALKTGTYFQSGANHNDLLTSIARLQGFDDVTSFGDPELCNAPLALPA